MAEKTDHPKRILALFDEHFPYVISAYHDPKHPKKETPVSKFLRDFDPHVLVHGGDQLDLDVIAHWNRGKPRIKENLRLKHAYDGYNALLDREDSLKSLETKIMLEGNHDQWINDLLDEQPELEGLIGIQENLRLKARGYKWVEQGKHYRIGKLNFIHGNYSSGYGAAHHAKAIAQIYCANVIYGHFHAHQSFTAVTPFDKHPYQTTCVGTLAHVNPLWKRNKPSAWINGFWAGYIFPNGNFSGVSINIINGKFVFDGTVYQ